MSDFDSVAPILAALVGALAILGAGLALVGSVGLLRLPTFFERVHPPTLGTTGGVGLTLAASVLLFSALESRPVVHEILIAVFTVVTTPVTYLLLVRAATHRDGVAGGRGASAGAAADPATDRQPEERSTQR
jgi:multicomponent K+:H+ antiporter subunit G